jgi:hypothetical protein
MIAVTPLEYIQKDVSPRLQWRESFARDFLLVWDWQGSEDLHGPGKYDSLIQESLKLELKTQLEKAIRKWNAAQLLGVLGEDRRAMARLQEAEGKLNTALKEYPHAKSQYSLIPLLFAASIGYDKLSLCYS